MKIHNSCQFGTLVIGQAQDFNFFSNFRAPWGCFDPLSINRVNFVLINLLRNVRYTKKHNACQFGTLVIVLTQDINVLSNFRTPRGHYDLPSTNRANVLRKNLFRNVCYTKTHNIWQLGTLIIGQTRVFNFFQIIHSKFKSVKIHTLSVWFRSYFNV